MNLLAFLILQACSTPTTTPAADAASPPATPAKAPAASASAPVTPVSPPAAGGGATVDTSALQPSKATAVAPEEYKVRFTTTKGPVTLAIHRAWAPKGADRFYNLVQMGFLKDIAYFRAISGFMIQFGIHGDPKVSAQWKSARIDDDPVQHSNTKGTITFATSGPNSRTTQVFINLVDNKSLDSMGFAPFGEVVEGMDIVNTLYTGYGEGAPRGAGPSQGRIQGEGNTYLRAEFPNLDYLQEAALIP